MLQPNGLKAALITAAAMLATTGVAQAHAHLISSLPAANAVEGAPSQITLKFSEAPMPKFSGVQLMGPAGHPVTLKPVKSTDKDTLAVTPSVPLQAGVYAVKWHAVTADTHRTQGTFSFTVR